MNSLLSSAKYAILHVYNPIANFYKNKILKVSHQLHYEQRTSQKWRLIEPVLPVVPGSMLDIGCSEGEFTRKAGALGWCAWGIEPKAEAIARATKLANDSGLKGVQFAAGVMSANAAIAMPTFDVILLLSVFHQLVAQLGVIDAKSMLRDLLAACRISLVIEMAGINRKYGCLVLKHDNDQESVDEFLASLLPSGWNAHFLGAIPYTDEEKNRFIYVIKRAI